MRARALVFLCLVNAALLAVPLAAQDVESLLSRSRYDADERERLQMVVADARGRGLPTDGLTSRLAEGIAKGIPAGRLQSALDADVENLALARDVILGVDGAGQILETAAAWERAGNLIRAGWSADALEELVVACSARPQVFRQASLFYIAVLEWGASANDALKLTAAVAASEIDPEEFPRITLILGQARSRRIEPERAVDMIAGSLRDGRSLRQIEGLFGR